MNAEPKNAWERLKDWLFNASHDIDVIRINGIQNLELGTIKDPIYRAELGRDIWLGVGAGVGLLLLARALKK